MSVLREAFETVPAAGDDRVQGMARRMWWMVLGMGVMFVLGALAFGSYAGVQFGEFFHLGADAADELGRAWSTAAWATGINFLGMGLILSAITMILVTIVSTLRDAGRDVQQAYGASEVVQLRKPTAGRFAPHVMAFGLMVLVAGVVFGFVAATKVGSIPALELSKGAGALTGENLARWGARSSRSAPGSRRCGSSGWPRSSCRSYSCCGSSSGRCGSSRCGSSSWPAPVRTTTSRP